MVEAMVPETGCLTRIETDSSDSILTFTGKGMTSRQQVSVDVKAGSPGCGVRFFVRNPKTADEFVELPARASTVVNTLRNVTLGKDGVRLCIVEHFLAAISLWGLEDLDVTVDGPELPLADGSANFWIDLLQNSSIPRQTDNLVRVDLKEPVSISKGDRSLVAIPDTKFSVTYMMDWDHPAIGKRWQSWDQSMSISDIADARTFGMLNEHQMLGLTEDVVSLTADGFTHPLRFPDEPVRHKLLDLIGDLTLIGINPLRVNARFISIKAGHELDVQLAAKLIDTLDLTK
jgi:UDP-3-O-[3-hydroxymyristoyl] N-acetylglucosamine deacetylase